MEIDPENYRIFKRGSATYFNSSRFFPPHIRRDVFSLYAFVRRADDYVDCVPQNSQGFYRFMSAWDQARQGRPCGDAVIDGFAELARRRDFKPAWAEAFLHSMQQDLSKTVYRSVQETLEYVYGSAEVIGLFMARILNLPPAADEPARMLGRAMQFINFIRDIAEDLCLGRTYLPLDETSLPDLSEASTRRDPAEFRRFMALQVVRYEGWQKQAELGYRHLPRRFLIPIRTAADMYLWTGRQIMRNPFVVYRRKVKPAPLRILARAAFNALRGNTACVERIS